MTDDSPGVLTTTAFATPIGPMFAVASTEALVALDFATPDRRALLDQRLRRWLPGRRLVEADSAPTAAARAWLAWYFAGSAAAAAPALVLDQRGTPFELAVWRAMADIPWGSTDTYSGLARRLGRPDAARAVGGASRRNPLGVVVPCHRVVGRTGALTGYGGGLRQKQWLLAHEADASALLGGGGCRGPSWTTAVAGS